MTPSRPYLIRAIYQWVVDNGTTPHLLVDVSKPSVKVPQEYVENNKIILNIGPMAAHGLILGNERIEFSARFAGKSLSVVVPIDSVLAIYARENGQGMVFNDDRSHKTGETAARESAREDKPIKPSSRPRLRVVK